MKFCKIANNSDTSQTNEDTGTDFESLELVENVDACLTKYKNNLMLLNKISHIFLVTTKLFIV